MSENRLSIMLLVALRDCASYPSGTYVWKQKSMEKLEALGYVRRMPCATSTRMIAWEITDEGRSELEANTR